MSRIVYVRPTQGQGAGPLKLREILRGAPHRARAWAPGTTGNLEERITQGQGSSHTHFGPLGSTGAKRGYGDYGFGLWDDQVGIILGKARAAQGGPERPPGQWWCTPRTESALPTNRFLPCLCPRPQAARGRSFPPYFWNTASPTRTRSSAQPRYRGIEDSRCPADPCGIAANPNWGPLRRGTGEREEGEDEGDWQGEERRGEGPSERARRRKGREEGKMREGRGGREEGGRGRRTRKDEGGNEKYDEVESHPAILDPHPRLIPDVSSCQLEKLERPNANVAQEDQNRH